MSILSSPLRAIGTSPLLIPTQTQGVNIVAPISTYIVDALGNFVVDELDNILSTQITLADEGDLTFVVDENGNWLVDEFGKQVITFVEPEGATFVVDSEGNHIVDAFGNDVIIAEPAAEVFVTNELGRFLVDEFGNRVVEVIVPTDAFLVDENDTFVVDLFGRRVVQIDYVGSGLMFDLPLQVTVLASKIEDVYPETTIGSLLPTEFTRATTATVEDFEGLLRTALSGEVRFKGARRVKNLISFPEDLSNAAWLKENTGAGTVPVQVSGNTYRFITGGIGSGDTSNISQITTTTVVGDVHTSRFLISASVAVDLVIWSNWNQSPTTISVTTTPQTFSKTDVATGVAEARIYFRLVGNVAGNVTRDITITKIQLEEATGQSNQNPSEYVSSDVESTPFHGAMVDGVQYFKIANGNTVASNVVTEITGAAFDATDSFNDASGPFGYMAEGQRQNLVLRNRNWEHVSWVKTTVTANDDEVAGPDERVRAASLTASAGNGTVIQDLGVIGSAAKVFGLWVKRKTGTGDIDLTLNGGGSWTTVIVTAVWTRVEITATLANPDVGIRIVTNADAIYVDWAQSEAAAFLSSTIVPETAGAAVTRNVDVLTYDDVGNILDAAGTAFADASTEWSTSSGTTIALGRDTNGRVFSSSGQVATLFTIDDGSNTSVSPIGTTMLNAPQKIAATWGSALTAYSPAALAPDVTPGSYDGTMGTGALGVGVLGSTGGNSWYGTIRNVKIYNREFNNAEVAAHG